MGTVSIDFKNGVYAINGVAKTVEEVVWQDPAFGYAFDYTDITAGVGIRVDSFLQGDSGTLWPFLTPEAFSALVIDGTELISGTVNCEVYSDAVAGVIAEGAAIGITLLDDAYLEANFILLGWAAGAAFGTGASYSTLIANDASDADPPIASNVPPTHTGTFTLSVDQLSLQVDANANTIIFNSNSFIPAKLGLDISLYGSVGANPPINNQYAILEGIEFSSSAVAGLPSTIAVGTVQQLPCFTPCIPHAIKRN